MIGHLNGGLILVEINVHLVHRLAVVVLLPLGLDLPPPGVHDLDHTVG